MGKGYNNYMCKKPFHPGSKANIKRAWMAEQKTENDKRKQEELKAQYEKEQDLYNNRALISSESKDKLELNFMYEAPPGAKRERQKEDDEPEFKFEWQRKYNAPREDYAKGNEDIKDQPFGIPVRNVRCIKCHKWGHINTDKECPLYHQASTSSMPTTSMDPMELMRQMKEDGFGLKEHVLGHQLNPAAANQQFIPSDDESDPEIDFLKSLSSAEKKKLLKKLKKLSKKQKSSNCKKKKKSKKTKKSKSKASFSSDSEKERKSKKRKSNKSSSSDSDSSSDQSDKRQSKHSEPKEKHLKYEKSKSKKHVSLKETHFDAENSEDMSQEKYNQKMCVDDVNTKKYTSKIDIIHKNITSEQKNESSYQGKHKTTETKHYPAKSSNDNLILDKYACKEDNTGKVRNEPKQKSYKYSKHKTLETKHSDKKYSKDTSEDDLILDTLAPKKVEKSFSRKESSEYKSKENNHEKGVSDLRTKMKEKHSSCNSEEKKNQVIKTEAYQDNIGLPVPPKKPDTSLCEENINLSRCIFEDIALKKIKTEPGEDFSSQGEHQSEGTNRDILDSQTEKKDSNSKQEKYQALNMEAIDDDVSLPTSKRKPETSASEDSSDKSSAKKVKYDHPDGFSHLCPQAHIESNYLHPNVEYEGKIHDKFRHHYREKRSPSVKQKYNIK